MIRVDIGTLAGILTAQRHLEKVIPADSMKYGLLQDIQARAKELSKDDALELMEALISLKNHCRTLELSQINVEGDLR